MKINSIGAANISFGKLEKGIIEKCEKAAHAGRETNALDKLYENGYGISGIAAMDDFILKDVDGIDGDGRLFALEFIENDVIKPKKPIYVGKLFDFMDGWTHGYGSDYIHRKKEIDEKVDAIRKAMDILA